MREEQTKITHYINKDSVVVEKVPLKPSSNKEELKVLPVLKVVDLIKYVSGIVEGLLSTQKVLLDDFRNEIWILFGGDKGGKHMKFHFEVINTNSSGSVFDVHMFAMYEASDAV